MSDDEEFCFRPARRTAEQKKEDLKAKLSAPAPSRPRPEHKEDAGTEEGRERAMELYNKELNDRIIFMGDDADAIYDAIKAHQGGDGNSGNDGQPSAVVYGVDLSCWPPNKPILICAAEYGRTEIVRCLIKDFGCDMNVRRSKDLNTAIHCAAYYGHNETVRCLMDLGADTTLVNKFGEKPIEAAKQGIQHWEVGQNKHKRQDQDPFYACFRSVGAEPRHTECVTLLESKN